MKNKINNIIKYLFNKNNRKKSIIYIVSSIVLVFFIIAINSSKAYYHNEEGMVIIHSRVNITRNDNYDYILYIFKETLYGSGNYTLANEIPDNNFVFDRYYCNNNSEFTYDSVSKKTTAIIEGKEVCRIYFNLVS